MINRPISFKILPSVVLIIFTIVEECQLSDPENMILRGEMVTYYIQIIIAIINVLKF